MNNDDLVSVIIPVFNVKPYISEAIESVLHQSYKNLEIIIVDDGSTDGSEDICDEYARIDKRIIVVHQDNKGLSGARNTGLDLMSGEVVAFLDADDALCSDYVSILMDTLIRERADVAMCRFTTHYTTEKMEKSRGKNATPEIEAGAYGRVDALCALCDAKINQSVWNKIYKRELWKDIRFPVGHSYEDVDTTFRIIDLCNKICVVNQSLYMYRIRPGSITRSPSINGYRDWDNNHAHFEEYISANIPEVFSELQLNRRCEDRLIAMITRYISLSYKKENEWREYKSLRMGETGACPREHMVPLNFHKLLYLTLRFVNANVSLAVIEYHYVEVLGRRKRKFSPKEQHSQVPAQRAATKNGCSSGESRKRVPKVQGRICRISQVKGQGSEAVNGR